MDKIRIYRDSKEIPVRIIERIETTGDFFYMIKGYDYGDEPNADVNKLKKQFEDIFENFIVEINSKHIDIVQYGKIASASLELDLLMIVYQFILLKIREIKISSIFNRDVDLSVLDDMIYYREAEFDSSSLIERLFEKLPQEAANKLLVKLKRDYEVDVE